MSSQVPLTLQDGGFGRYQGAHSRAENPGAHLGILPQHVILDVRDLDHKVCHLGRLRLKAGPSDLVFLTSPKYCLSKDLLKKTYLRVKLYKM